MNRRNTMPKNTKPAETITAQTLLSLVGCSNATLSRWIGKGLPHTRERTGHGGAQMLLFRREDALAWIEMNANTQAATAARAARKANRPEPIPTAAELPNVDELDGEGLLECLARLKRTERDSFRLLQKLKRAADVSGVRLVSERYTSECRALVALEQAATNYRLRNGELGNVADMKGVFLKVVTGLKNAVMGIPSAAIPQLMAHLKNPDSAQAVFGVLDRLVRDTLRDVAERRGATEPGTAGKPDGA
jgi:phage gp46-like protein